MNWPNIEIDLGDKPWKFTDNIIFSLAELPQLLVLSLLFKKIPTKGTVEFAICVGLKLFVFFLVSCRHIRPCIHWKQVCHFVIQQTLFKFKSLLSLCLSLSCSQSLYYSSTCLYISYSLYHPFTFPSSSLPLSTANTISNQDTPKHTYNQGSK